MKCIFKILGVVVGALLMAKALQILIDYLYKNYGKHYITTEELD